jgi:hypothetical protein
MASSSASRTCLTCVVQAKERRQWEGNVTSHFSEVEEFDLSFS